MGFSAIAFQRDNFTSAFQTSLFAPHERKYLVLDDNTRRQLFMVTDKSDVIRNRILDIHSLEQSRRQDQSSDALYVVRPRLDVAAYIVADFQRHMYKSAGIIWTSEPPPNVEARITNEISTRGRLRGFRVHSLDYFAQESHLVTMRNLLSFPFLFHPRWGSRLNQHTFELARKVSQFCISLGERPLIRFYKPLNSDYAAAERSVKLAVMVRDMLSNHKLPSHNPQNPAPSARSTIIFLDRSVDLVAPLLHEFSYQAMAYDLLRISESDKIVVKMKSGDGPNDATEEQEIKPADPFWLKNRHLLMQDVIPTIESEIDHFKKTDPNIIYKGQEIDAYQLREMAINKPIYEEKMRTYSLHLNMTTACMTSFETNGLEAVASLEQTMATGWDEDQQKAKNITPKVIEVLAQENVQPSDRIRLLCLYYLFREGLIPSDSELLLAHSNLPSRDIAILHGFKFLGGPGQRELKQKVEERPKLFPVTKPPQDDSRYLSRYECNVKHILAGHIANTLREDAFPFIDNHKELYDQVLANLEDQKSLRTNRPTWHKGTKGVQPEEQKPKIFVVMTGGATYSEARTCYELGKQYGQDVVLFTTNMLTPGLFLSQVGDLNVNITMPPLEPRDPVIPPMEPEHQPVALPTPPPPPPHHQPQATPPQPTPKMLPPKTQQQMAGQPQAPPVNAKPKKPKSRWLRSG